METSFVIILRKDILPDVTLSCKCSPCRFTFITEMLHDRNLYFDYRIAVSVTPMMDDIITSCWIGVVRDIWCCYLLCINSIMAGAAQAAGQEMITPPMHHISYLALPGVCDIWFTIDLTTLLCILILYRFTIDFNTYIYITSIDWMSIDYWFVWSLVCSIIMLVLL